MVLVAVTWEVARLLGDTWLLLSLRDALAQSSEAPSLGSAPLFPGAVGRGEALG